LPNENALTKMTPLSLGTIQRALRDLAANGLLERRQGAGSFVARSSRLLPYPLHCRFLNDANDGSYQFSPQPCVVGARSRRGHGSGGSMAHAAASFASIGASM